MRFSQLQIDYYPGSHGIFLDYLINRFLLELPSAKAFNPLTEVGSSHNAFNNLDYQRSKNTVAYHKSASHFVSDEYKKIYKSDNIVDFPIYGLIRIDVDTEYLLEYNTWYTVNDNNIDLDTLEINTQEKFIKISKSFVDSFIQNCGDKKKLYYI
jgi:hypothetical protein